MSALVWTTKSTRNLAAELTRRATRCRIGRWRGCCASWGSACRATPRSPRAASTPTGTPSSATSTTRSRPPGGRGSRWSGWTPRRRNWSAPSRTAAGSGSPPGTRSGSTSTTSPTRTGQGDPVRRLRRRANTGWVRSAPTTTPRLRGRDHAPLVGRRRPDRYPDADRLLICADGGGSNGYRVRAWKSSCQPRRRDRAGGHRLPPAARHQQVEQDRAPAVLPHHPELARPAAGQPRGHRRPDRRHHHRHRPDRPRRTRHRHLPDRLKFTEADVAPCPITPHDFHGEWNYTVAPADTPTPTELILRGPLRHCTTTCPPPHGRSCGRVN